MSSKKILKNALVSLSNKKHLLEIAQILLKKKINLLATGGTAKYLKNHNVPVIEIAEYTNFPEILNGRVKTMHPKIIAGILYRRDKDQKTIQSYDILPIDIVIVNFYPFDKIDIQKEYKIEEMIEKIDIGGPTLVRSAAKNYKDVIVIVNFFDFKLIFNSIENNYVSIEKRLYLANQAFLYTSRYEKSIEQYFTNENKFNEKNKKNLFPDQIKFQFVKKQNLRYGENQHQKSALYIKEHSLTPGTISSSYQVHGKKLSYNNISDADIALECVKEFYEPACVIVKHGNPCGVSEKTSLLKAYISAYKADPISAFGGIIAFNSIIDVKTAEEIIQRQFVEVIIAPEINHLSLEILKKKKNIRILITGKFKKNNEQIDFKRITNGLLVQEHDKSEIDIKKFNFVTKRLPTEKELQDAIFCWKIVKYIKSNAILYGLNKTTISIGSGQTSRVDATQLANLKAKDRGFDTTGAVMASDAFFPFRDGVDKATSIGIKCIIQPGGSIRDQEVIECANEYNIAMIFTQQRHFKH
ncbi:bifunctional phosphoribosylaminoimidazolecarboxamide formyltransferase/IMP cyclohydrolase [Buchnera aphidicola (Aphis nasturtii)]|uniref:bifunctional phosphoribosylaminoimidazolecarboxamide formyltransferase/IMP cyclohydrolase n=1 Tax=Buchnera aphidicola TaxID=9 RepID=UPI0010C35421|nr:bifunctional phosphoribosylaminoimidazolecarboxamide formyltransferase/IMP cyclohydrolase [Buchnera aphidicola]QCI18031.1 bifunctional phosphoribosylaminoimidazolecarboxamide formyltransferase/IMP cyclohydrolase [Buchnera aphidicola (Aphis nasturtii)]